MGKGKERKRFGQQIQNSNLQDKFTLLGRKQNPYPYIRRADIFTLTSVYEGPLVIAEAKVLHKPILIANFSAVVRDIIQLYRTGLIVERSAEAIAQELKELLLSKQLRQKLTRELSKCEGDKEHIVIDVP